MKGELLIKDEDEELRTCNMILKSPNQTAIKWYLITKDNIWWVASKLAAARETVYR